MRASKINEIRITRQRQIRVVSNKRLGAGSGLVSLGTFVFFRADEVRPASKRSQEVPELLHCPYRICNRCLSRRPVSEKRTSRDLGRFSSVKLLSPFIVRGACVKVGGMPYFIKTKGKTQKEYYGFRLKSHARDFAKRKNIKHYVLIFFKFIKGPSK
jgi:hypothetical protein